MAETEAIAKISEILSKEIFNRFGWEFVGALNQNWACAHLVEHGKEKVKTHPADIIFFYDDPYSKNRIYLHTDLKSYAKSTLEAKNYTSTLKSLAQQIECAEVSQEWKDKFLHTGLNHLIHGLLFVYNHDGDGEIDIVRKIMNSDFDEVDIPERKRIYIIDPIDIEWIVDVSHGIMKLKADDLIKEDYRFYYEQKTYEGVDSYHRSATIELIKSNFIILKSSEKNRTLKLKVFYRGLGETEAEFQYLIDYFRHNSFLDYEDDSIDIYFLHKIHTNSANNFDKARQKYSERFAKDHTTLSKCIDQIKLHILDHVDKSKSFNENIIGMGNR